MRGKTVLFSIGSDQAKQQAPVEIRDGKPYPIPGATSFYLRYPGIKKNGKLGRVVEPLGKDLAVAFAAYQNRELNQARAAKGLLPIESAAKSLIGDFKAGTSNRASIADAAAKFIAELKSSVLTGEKSKGTLVSYSNAVERFRDNCGVQFMEDISAEVLKAYKLWLYENTDKRIRGDKATTIANNFRYIGIFLRQNGLKIAKSFSMVPGDTGIMNWKDYPRAKKIENHDMYSHEEINALLGVADVDEADQIHFFLKTGVRDGEAANMTWDCINWKKKEIRICDKPQYKWRVKDREARTINTDDAVLWERLEARKSRQKPGDLLFPNRLGTPDVNLIDRLHKVAEKAKANGFVFDGPITQHKFRRTYASLMVGKSDIQTVKQQLGHSDVKTTAGYLVPDTEKARTASKTAFAEIGG